MEESPQSTTRVTKTDGRDEEKKRTEKHREEKTTDNGEQYDKENCENKVKEKNRDKKENKENNKEEKQKDEREILKQELKKEDKAQCLTSIDDFLGHKYVQISYDKFDEYLKYMGYGYMMRTASLKLHPVHCLTRNPDDTYTFTMNCMLANSSITFKPAEEFYEKKPDGSTVKALVTLEGNRMTHVQAELNGRTSRHVREFHRDQMTVKTTVDGWHEYATRRYNLYEARS